MDIDGKTRFLGVLGHPIQHTASPAMLNAAFKALGLNLCYGAFDVEPRNLPTAIRGMGVSGFLGVNLTVPHKTAILPYLDVADLSVCQSGAANTLVFSKKSSCVIVHGHNTDGRGLLRALEEEFHFQPRGKKIAIVGCGGAGRGAAIQLALSGVKKLILLNRTSSRAHSVARRVRELKPSVICSFIREPCDLVVQATSLGLKPNDPLPLAREGMLELDAKYFFEMIYRPAETPAMRLANRLGCKSANGLGMLLHQGALAFEIWTGRKAPIALMRGALMKEIYGT